MNSKDLILGDFSEDKEVIDIHNVGYSQPCSSKNSESALEAKIKIYGKRGHPYPIPLFG